MATSRKTGLRTADIPQIDAVKFSDPAHTKAWEQMRLAINTRFGKSSNEADRAVTWADLVENGVVSMRGKNGQLISGSPGNFVPTVPIETDGLPPAPTGVKVTPGLSTVIVEWNKPTFSYFGYAEIFRSTENNQSKAVSIGQATSWLYTDPTGSTGATYYYWVRFVSKGGQRGPFNAVDGVSGQVSLDPAYLIDVLSSDNPEALLYEIKEQTIINGVVVPPGIYMRDMYVANGSISNAKIGNAAIDDAKIASLSANKVTFGEMSGDRIATNSLNADRLITNTLTTKLASITEAYVGSANIQDAVINTAHIDTLDASIIKSGYISVDRLQAGTIGSTKFTDFLESDAKDAQGKPYIRLNFRTGEAYFAGNATFGMGAKFGGELVGASGTFSGRLTADAINAVSTINIANGAVSTTHVNFDPSQQIIEASPGGTIAESWWMDRSTLHVTTGANDEMIILMTISGRIYKTDGRSAYGAVQVVRDGTTVLRTIHFGGGVSSLVLPASTYFSYDRPGAGSHSYLIRLRWWDEGSYSCWAQCTESGLLILSMKK